MSWSHIALTPAPDGIATLLVNRPAKLNALNRATLEEIDEAVTRCHQDEAIRAIIVTGAGEKAFVAGADIQELATLSPLEAQRLALRGQAIFRRIELLNKPSAAAVHGFALGGGLELAMACTVRVASSQARLGQPEVKLGIIPGFGGTQRLPRLVGRGRALEMLLTGEPIDATEALRIGLVNHVVEPPALLDFCRALLAKMLANGPAALALTLQSVDAGLSSSLEEGLRFEAAAFGLSAATHDRREGTSAFLEKRKPSFQGK